MQFSSIKKWLAVSLLLIITGTANAQLCTTKEATAWDSKAAGLDTTTSRGLADNFFLWNVGQTINVRFLNGTEEQQRAIIALAKTWEQYANVKFAWVTAEPSNVRVEFSNREENYSQLGTNSNMVPDNQHTLHLEYALFNEPQRLQRTVVHEFGHVLGFMHEHSSPISGIQWNKDTMYKVHAKYGWDQDMVDAQIFKVYGKRYTNGTTYDPKSIMHYPIPAWQTMNGYNVGWNTEISEGDKQLASMLYPAGGQRQNEVPRVNVLNYSTTLVKADAAAGGIYLYPSFEVTTDGATGDVFFAVLLFDKDGNGIRSTDEKYNVNGCVGTYKSFRIGPGKRLNANKTAPDDFPLFIPFSNIPNVPANAEIQIQFRTYVSDGEELKSVYYSEPIAYRMTR